MSKLISSCGLDCSTCDAFLATQSGDDTAKAKIAVEWSARYEAQLSAADINCVGCVPEGAKFNWCTKCPIRACVLSKGFTTCAECSDFPCATNQFLYDAVPAAKANIEELRN